MYPHAHFELMFVFKRLLLYIKVILFVAPIKRATYPLHTTDRDSSSDSIWQEMRLLLLLHSPSYICAYCGKPAARNHLQASAASISETQNK